MIKVNCNERSYTEFVIEDYFPVIVSANDYVYNISYVEYGCDNNSLLEFTVNKVSKSFYRMKLVLCKRFEKSSENIELPALFKDGTIIMDVPEKNTTDTLFTTVYSNGVEIRLSDEEAIQYYKNGDLFIGTDSNGELCIIKVSGLSEPDLEHVLNELSYQAQD